MSEETKEKQPEMTADELADVVYNRFEEKKAAEEEKARLEELERKAKEYDKLKEEKEDEVAWAEAKGTVNVKKKTKKGFSDEQEILLDEYLRGRVDAKTAQKALQEGNATEGGVLVPTDFTNRIVELRDPMSFPRQMGVQTINTTRDNIDIPAESTSFTKFSRTAEEANYSTNDPAFAQNNVTVEKWTKLFKVSEELVADDAYDLEGFLERAIARAMAQTEAYYVALGTGSNQHQGIFTGGDTDALTFDSTGNITPDEIWELFYTLGEGYRPNAAWLMNDQTWRYILSIRDTNDWAFGAADLAEVDPDRGQAMLCGKPVYFQDDIDTIASGKTVIMFGDPFYYGLVDRAGLEIQVLQELYAATGQIGYKCHFRQSGAVLYEFAWVGGQMA